MPQTITNIPRCLPQILTVPKFWYHLTHLFSCKNVPFDFEMAFWEAEGALSKPKGPFLRENEAQEMTPKLLALAKVCSVLGNICDVSWHLSKLGSELEKRWTFSILDKNCAHKNKAWFKSIFIEFFVSDILLTSQTQLFFRHITKFEWKEVSYPWHLRRLGWTPWAVRYAREQSASLEGLG